MSGMLNALSEVAVSQPSSAFTLLRRPAKERRALACWLALPDRISAEAPPLIAVHGIRRCAKDQAALFAPRATALGRPVIAPLFDADHWPRYQQVVRKGRADLALLALLAELRAAGIWGTPDVELAGFSGGAQFVHRFAMLYPTMVTRLTVASAGWYTFPDGAAFPYGLAARPGRADDWGPRLAGGLERFLRLPIQVCVGERDNLPDPNTRSGPEIDRQQGRDRVARAIGWADALRRAARERGIAPRVAMTLLPRCGHDFRACVRRGGLDRLVLPDQSASSSAQSDSRRDEAPPRPVA